MMDDEMAPQMMEAPADDDDYKPAGEDDFMKSYRKKQAINKAMAFLFVPQTVMWFIFTLVYLGFIITGLATE